MHKKRSTDFKAQQFCSPRKKETKDQEPRDPTDPFSNLEPQNHRWIFCNVQDLRATVFAAPKLWKGRSWKHTKDLVSRNLCSSDSGKIFPFDSMNYRSPSDSEPLPCPTTLSPPPPTASSSSHPSFAARPPVHAAPPTTATARSVATPPWTTTFSRTRTWPTTLVTRGSTAGRPRVSRYSWTWGGTPAPCSRT